MQDAGHILGFIEQRKLYAFFPHLLAQVKVILTDAFLGQLGFPGGSSVFTLPVPQLRLTLTPKGK